MSGESDSPSSTQASDTQTTNYALHVALQTMKERCQSLQQRLAVVEDENITLRMQVIVDSPKQGGPVPSNARNEIDDLSEKVGQLTRQKYQLTEHIAMVATENRQLWSRLSKLTKDNQNLGTSLDKMKESVNTANNSQNLIRSKTFTQNSPNPILRLKMNATDATNATQKVDNFSLEEISLKVLNEFLEGKAEVEKKCNEIMTSPTTIKNSFGFGYLNDEQTAETDLQYDIRKCSDGMTDIKKELLRQQSDIKVALSSLRQRRSNFACIFIRFLNKFSFCLVLEVCPACKNHAKKPITADKKMETDDIITNRYDDQSLTLTTSKSSAAQLPGKPEPTVHIDFLEQKRLADTVDKMCPMCAKVYSSSSTFDDFQDHVESHFIDDSELDGSIDRNFEIVSHAVGNF